MASRNFGSSHGASSDGGGSFISPSSRIVPGNGYIQQELPWTSMSVPPPEKIADAIHAFRQLMSGGRTFSLRNWQTISETTEFVKLDIVQYFQSQEGVMSFLRAYPQYFTFKFSRYEAVTSYYFTEDGFMELLRQHRISEGSKTSVPYTLIESVGECKRHVARLRNQAIQKLPLIIAMDCEGVKLGKKGPLTLLQLGTAEGEIFIFDVLATPNREDMFVRGGLKGLLEDKNVLKVIHDCRADQCALYFQFGVTLTNVFDTSVAFTTLWDQFNVQRGPFRPKLSTLLQVYGFEAKQKTGWFAAKVREGHIFGERPLTSEMIEYAADDVLCLHVIYENFNRLISPLWTPYFAREVQRDLYESCMRDVREVFDRKKLASVDFQELFGQRQTFKRRSWVLPK